MEIIDINPKKKEIVGGITRHALLGFHNEIQNQLKGSVLAYLLKGRIADFYKDHGLRIDGILDGQRKIIEEYYEIEGTEIKTQDVTDAEGKVNKVGVMKEGKTAEEFNGAMNAFMKEPIPFQ